MPDVSGHAKELWRSPEQGITSADTSINDKRLPAGYGSLLKKNVFKKNQIVVDIGGGKFDNAVEKLKSLGAHLYVYDPFNRTQEHNNRVVEAVADGGADVAVSNNTFNVIAEDSNIIKAIAQAHNALRQNGKAYFSVYEGDKTGIGKETSKGFQRNLPTSAYIDMVKEVFGQDVKRQGNIIVATKQPLTLKDKDLLFKQGGSESEHGYIPPVIKTADESMPLYIPDFLVGESMFPIVGDRLMVGMFKARSGNTFECRGGHDHPLVEAHQGQVAWACGQSGDEIGQVALGLKRAIEASPNGYAVTCLMHPEAHASNRTFARIAVDELLYDYHNVKGGKRIVEAQIKRAMKVWTALMKKDKKFDLIERVQIKSIEDLPVHLPTINFEQRKPLIQQLLHNDYKKENKSSRWKRCN